MPFTGAVLDDFNTGASQNLTARAGWGASVFWTGDVTLVTDTVPTKTVSPAGWSSNWWSGSLADCECWVTEASAATLQYLHTRGSGQGTASPSAYRLEWGGGAGNWNLKVMTAGALGAAILSGTQSVSVGDSIGMSSTGTTHEVWYRAGAGAWVSQGSVVDATFASGVIAVEIPPSGVELDAFGGGAPVTGTLSGPRQQAVPFTRGAGGGGRI